jgi:hypothetical protein
MDKTFCSQVACMHEDCSRHQYNAPDGMEISIADLNDGWCFDERKQEDERSSLLTAICRGTQKTNYKCDDVCKAMCGNDGTCAYCSIIADAIEEAFRKED